MLSSIFWDTKQQSVKISRRLGGKCHLKVEAYYLILAGFFLVFLSDPENGGGMFLQNVL
jgi:hypothetical protein